MSDTVFLLSSIVSKWFGLRLDGTHVRPVPRVSEELRFGSAESSVPNLQRNVF